MLQIAKRYYQLLDENCEHLKGIRNGGVGWFAHLYSDGQERAYGIYNTSGQLKFPFKPQTSC